MQNNNNDNNNNNEIKCRRKDTDKGGVSKNLEVGFAERRRQEIDSVIVRFQNRENTTTPFRFDNERPIQNLRNNYQAPRRKNPALFTF